jgi:PAS domain S-box-containing protein
MVIFSYDHMQLITRKHTKHYFISIFLVISLLFIIFSAVIYQNYQDAQKVNKWTLYNYEVVRQSRRIMQDLVDMENGVRGYLLTGKEQFLEPYRSSSKTIKDQIAAMFEYSKNDNDTHDNLKVWLEKIDVFSSLLKEQVAAAGTSPISMAVLEKQKAEMDGLRVLLDDYINQRLNVLNHQILDFKTKQYNFKYILLIGTILAVGIMFLVTMVILALLRRNQLAEEETAVVEERFKTVINGINDGLYDFNFIEKTVYYSPSYKAMLGYIDEEYPNTLESLDKNLHPDDANSFWENTKKYREGVISEYRNIFRMRHKNGSWIWILSRGVGMRNEDGEMVRLIGTHTDVTEEKQREEDLTQLNQEMETFTYITSHDLRSPLVNMKGFAAEIEFAFDKISPLIQKVKNNLSQDDQKKLDEAMNEDIPESLRFIKGAVEKMDKLTTAVLDLSRIGKRDYNFAPVDCNELIKRCLDVQGYELTQKEIEVTYGEMPTIYSDALALEQVFSNILDNAVKYTDSSRKGIINISSAEIDSEVVFSFKDNGRGIDEADQHKVFQSFRRARNTSDVRGLGMGMTFVQATVRRLGGSIWFQSKAGEGTTFYLRLPKRRYKKGNIV